MRSKTHRFQMSILTEPKRSRLLVKDSATIGLNPLSRKKHRLLGGCSLTNGMAFLRIRRRTENPPFLRKLDSSKHYPEDMVSERYADSNMWSACLWKLLLALGREKADRIILDSNNYLTPHSTFTDAANSILNSDQRLYQGTDLSSNRSVLSREEY